jgi:hypothetical protein
VRLVCCSVLRGVVLQNTLTTANNALERKRGDAASEGSNDLEHLDKVASLCGRDAALRSTRTLEPTRDIPKQAQEMKSKTVPPASPSCGRGPACFGSGRGQSIRRCRLRPALLASERWSARANVASMKVADAQVTMQRATKLASVPGEARLCHQGRGSVECSAGPRLPSGFVWGVL